MFRYVLFRNGYRQKMKNICSRAIENNDIAISPACVLDKQFKKKETKAKTHFMNPLLAS